MTLVRCPSQVDLQHLFLGGISEAVAEDIETHVQRCDACTAKLSELLAAKDTLADLLCGETHAESIFSTPALPDLMTRIVALRVAVPYPAQQGASMIVLSCSACQKKLSVKEELAGKKVKCPGCGQVTAVPSKVAVPAGVADQRTLPPAPIEESSSVASNTSAPSHGTVGERPTHPPLSKPDATLDIPRPEGEHDSSLTDFLAPPQAPDELGRLGDYRILKILGHGGMGVVFLGEDATLNRKVAIKAMLPHLAKSANSRQRFLREARAAAALEHDHIVPIFHVGEDRGAPYIVMPFLKGQPLDERLKSNEPMPLADILRIGREIAEGLAAAHAQGLIHRDIKPANVWLEAPRDRVKILDFGLARAATQDSGLTQQGSVIGTPAYMAPEQGRGDNVDARCDLFSLGVVLYRMTTGQMPFQGNDTVSTLMSVALHEPALPVMVNLELPQELSDLVMKLLEKDVAQRLGSAGEVVKALQKMEKEQARLHAPADDTIGQSYVPPTKQVRQKSTDTQVMDKPRQASRSRRPIVLAAILFAVVLLGGAGTLALLLQMGVIRFPTEQGDFVLNTDDPDLSFKVSKGAITLLDEKTKRPYKLKVVPDGEGKFKLDVATDELNFQTDTFTIKRGDTIALKAWFEPKKLAGVNPKDNAGKTPPIIQAGSPLDALRADAIPAEERVPNQPKELVAVLGTRHMVHWGWPQRMAFSPDGKMLATSPEVRGNQPMMDGIRLWDVATMRERAFLPVNRDIVIGFTSDGTTLLTVDAKKGAKLRLWDVTGPEPKERKAILPDIDVSSGLRWAEQGNRLIFWTRDKIVKLWDFGSESKKASVIPATPNWDLAAAISADGTRFAQADGAKIRLWDLTAAAPIELPIIQTLFKKGTDGRGLVLTPDGKMLLAIEGGVGDLHRWDLSGPEAKPLKPLPTKDAIAVAMDPSGKQIALGFRLRPRIEIHALAGNEPPRVYTDDRQYEYLAFSPDGKTLAINQTNDCNALLLDLTGPELKLRNSPQVAANRLAFTPDGKMLLGQTGWHAHFWDLTGDLRRPPESGNFRGRSIAVSSDGKLLATAQDNLEMRVWELGRGAVLPGIADRKKVSVTAPLQFVPTERRLALGYEDGKVQLWNLSDDQAKPGVIFQGQTKPVRSLNFSGDGKYLGCYSGDANSVQFWDLGGPEPKKDALLNVAAKIRSVALSPDGRTLASYVTGAPGDPHQCWLWEVGPGLTPKRRAVISYPGGHDGFYDQMSFAPDGKTLVTLGYEGNLLNQFDAVTGKKLREWTFPGSLYTFAFASDSRHVALANSNGTTYILRLEGTPTTPTPVSVEKK